MTQISKKRSNYGKNFPPHFLPSRLESQIMVFSNTEKRRIIHFFGGMFSFTFLSFLLMMPL